MAITILWHIAHEFYNVRVPKGMKTISASAMSMRHKVYNVEGVNWGYHMVLTLDEATLEKKKDGVDSSVLTTYFKKVKEMFPKQKHFWKYEEGGKTERPHFHLLFDGIELEKKKKEIEDVIQVGKWNEFIESQKKYKVNEGKTGKELIMGYFMHKLWGKGLVLCKKIRNQEQLEDQVENDIMKHTGTKGFKKNKRKYGFSMGLKIKKVLKEKEYEWAGNVDKVQEAINLLEETKENFISHFEELGKERGYSGNIVYERTITDLEIYKEETEKALTDEEKFVQTDLDKLIEKTKKAIRN